MNLFKIVLFALVLNNKIDMQRYFTYYCFKIFKCDKELLLYII